MKVNIAVLEEIFNTQIATLNERQCPPEIVEMLLTQKEAVIAKASDMEIFKSNLPFLPVIPLSCRTIYDLMAMVRYAGNPGYANFEPNRLPDIKNINDGIDDFQKPYYIFDVDEGEIVKDRSPVIAEGIIKEIGTPLALVELISFCVHSSVLSRHSFVLALGSRFWKLFGEQPLVPEISAGGRTDLTFCSVYADGAWTNLNVYPFCKSRGI